VRHGVHSNTAFGLRRILVGARTTDRHDLVDIVAGAARRFYAEDAAWNFTQERSGHDFLSPGLCEADLMVEVLTDDEREYPLCWGPSIVGTGASCLIGGSCGSGPAVARMGATDV